MAHNKIILLIELQQKLEWKLQDKFDIVNKIAYLKEIMKKSKKNQWQIRWPYDIGIVATMSAGKSTLLNALIGKEILHAANEATTAKITTIFHHNQSKPLYGSAKLKNGKIIRSKQLTEQQLRDWNADKEVRTIDLHLSLQRLSATKRHYPVLYDTPGPNNSQDEIHAKVTYEFVKHKKLDLLIYILNATQLGIQDDKYFLNEIRSIQNNQVQPAPILFVLNKVDELDPEKGETLDKTLHNSRQYLENLGFKEPEILPVSAQKALLALKWLNNQPLRRVERSLLKKYLYDYVSEREIETITKAYPKHQEIALRMVEDSGIVVLEQSIQCKINSKSSQFKTS